MAKSAFPTYGDFIEEMKRTKCAHAQKFLKEWEASSTEADWQKFRPMPLTRVLVLDFARNASLYFQNIILDDYKQEVCSEITETGHAFLRWINEKAIALGAEIEVGELDTALTPAEALTAALA